MNQRIQILPDDVINKIAAGEVIERPASVVKELVENAIDAGATRVEVEAVQGGTQLIAVSDNGSGMSRDNALMAIERHATSKLRKADEVEAVATLGFRGEALSSIAAVSRFTLITRPAEELGGTRILVSGGRVQDVLDEGCPPGTRFEVRNLFFNVPARRKFLRTEPTELAQIRQLFAVYALAHPEIGFRLVCDGREVYNLPGGASLGDRIVALYGPTFLSHLRRLDLDDGSVQVSGYAGLPQTGRKDRSDQYVFINGRPASAPVIHHALNEAYHAVLARGRYPSAFLFIRLPPPMVDVNVHPAKKEVRFRRPDAVRDAVIAAVQQALALEAPAAEKRSPGFAFDAPRSPVPPAKQRELRMESAASVAPDCPSRREGVCTAPDVAAEQAAAPWHRCRVLGQAGGLYVVLETDEGLVLMDPQAAHERVLFEKFMRDLTAGRPLRQGLLAPETVELMPAEAEALRRQLPALDAMGFGIAEFGRDAFLIDALPIHLQSGSPIAVLSGVAQALERGGTAARATRDALRETVARAACRLAVPSGERLSLVAIEKLVAALAKTEMPYTCPQGRPTLIFTSFAELHRKFGR